MPELRNKPFQTQIRVRITKKQHIQVTFYLKLGTKLPKISINVE